MISIFKGLILVLLAEIMSDLITFLWGNDAFWPSTAIETYWYFTGAAVWCIISDELAQPVENSDEPME